jgi:hypothetical protein
MGTRGAYGFYIDGQTFVTYNHYDSYPSALGESVVKFLRENKINDALRNKVRNLRGVQEDDVPSDSDILKCKNLEDNSVGEGKGGKPYWYQLLRNGQGDLSCMLEAGAYIDNKNFLSDSLFCEWAFVVNLDDNVLEVYKGFQEKAHTKGRYSDWPIDGKSDYFPVALVKEIPFNDLPAVGKLEDRVSESDVEALARTGGRL